MKLILIFSTQGNNQINLLSRIDFLSPLLATALLGLFTSTGFALPFLEQVAQSP